MKNARRLTGWPIGQSACQVTWCELEWKWEHRTSWAELSFSNNESNRMNQQQYSSPKFGINQAINTVSVKTDRLREKRASEFDAPRNFYATEETHSDRATGLSSWTNFLGENIYCFWNEKENKRRVSRFVIYFSWNMSSQLGWGRSSPSINQRFQILTDRPDRTGFIRRHFSFVLSIAKR